MRSEKLTSTVVRNNKQEVLVLKDCLRNYEVEDESIQPSRNDEITRLLMELNIKVIDNGYEIPFPMKKNVIHVLPDNFNYALERTALLHRQALKNWKMKRNLSETFDELILSGWLTPVDSAFKRDSCWYLPFFCNKTKVI